VFAFAVLLLRCCFCDVAFAVFDFRVLLDDVICVWIWRCELVLVMLVQAALRQGCFLKCRGSVGGQNDDPEGK
jgi:hypothetical protein